MGLPGVNSPTGQMTGANGQSFVIDPAFAKYFLSLNSNAAIPSFGATTANYGSFNKPPYGPFPAIPRIRLIQAVADPFKNIVPFLSADAQADFFGWRDDLLATQPDDFKDKPAAWNPAWGWPLTRPLVGKFDTTTGQVFPDWTGDYSWFLTCTLNPSEAVSESPSTFPRG